MPDGSNSPLRKPAHRTHGVYEDAVSPLARIATAVAADAALA
jgi:hypothetical protein